MTLKALRQNAPARDRNDAALVPSKPVQWTSARDGSRYLAVHFYPRNLAELAAMSGEYAEAAVSDACWGAVGLWLMKDCPTPDQLRNSFSKACEAVLTWSHHERATLGWPHPCGEQWKTSAFSGLDPYHQREAKLVAAETLEDWEAAGSPWIDERRLKPVFERLTSSPAFINKYVGPDDAANTQEKA